MDIKGDEGGNALPGTDDSDHIEGFGGSDYISGGLGDDKIEGGSGNDTLLGGDNNDLIYGGPGTNYMEGNSGNDTLIGGDDGDTIRGGYGIDVIFAGRGDDTVDGGMGNDFIDAGLGHDTISSYFSSGSVTIDLSAFSDGSGGVSGGSEGVDQLFGFEDIVGGQYDDVLIGQNLNNNDYNLIQGGAGNDKIFGKAGIDQLEGQDGNDTLDGGDQVDVLFGGAGNDTLKGGGDNDYMDGGTGNDTADFSSSVAGVNADLGLNVATGEGTDKLIGIENLIGSNFNDTLCGLYGTEISSIVNVLNGGGGSDTLIGRAGADILTGGAGNDFFSYAGTGQESTPGLGKRDVITDFTHGVDKLDLHLMDATFSTAGNSAFCFIGSANFSAEGQVRVAYEGGDTIVQVNNSNTSTPEFEMQLSGQLVITASDFVL
jgi:Ca2+-binding RTX toxin-like protein